MTGDIGGQYLRLLDTIAARITLPAVREVFVPPAAGGCRTGRGFAAAVLVDGSVGLTYARLADTAAGLAALVDRKAMAGRDPVAAAHALWEQGPAARALAMGLVNAVGQCILARVPGMLAERADSLALLAPRRGERWGMVGYFPPLVARLRRDRIALVVLELEADLVTRQEGFEVTLDAARLADCDGILCTSSVLLNDTLDAVLAHCPPAARLAIVGPGAGFLPDPLFARGIDVVGAQRVVDSAEFLARCRRGAPWGPASRKYCIRRDDYPGAAAVLDSLADA